MKDYIVYECKVCGLIIIFDREQLEIAIAENKDRYLSCNLGHRKIKKLNEYDSIKECMDNHVWKRVKGKIKQIK